MLAFARETRLSETTFVQPATVAGEDYRNRIWTVGEELPFAGHPSLGTAGRGGPREGREGRGGLCPTDGAGLQPLEVVLGGGGAGVGGAGAGKSGETGGGAIGGAGARAAAGTSGRGISRGDGAGATGADATGAPGSGGDGTTAGRWPDPPDPRDRVDAPGTTNVWGRASSHRRPSGAGPLGSGV